MASIKVTENITVALASLIDHVKNMTPAFKQIADYEWAATKLRYKEALDPDLKEWPDPITIRRDGGNTRRKQGVDPWKYVLKSNYHAAPPGYHFFDPFRDRPMFDTGSLFASIGRAYGKDYAIVGTDKEYAPKLQNGRFPFLGINAKTEENVEKVVKFYLMGAVK